MTRSEAPPLINMKRLFRNYRSFSRNMGNIKKDFSGRLGGTGKLKSNNFVVTFKHEGNIDIVLPSVNLHGMFSGKNRKRLKDIYMFSRRPDSEALLRKVIYLLYQNGIISTQQSIVDIGSWLSDNVVVWSKYLDGKHARVYAIDPSASNIEFGKTIASMNGCNNISWNIAVCSDREGDELFFPGDLSHTRFNEDGEGVPSPLKTTTLDSIVGKANWSSIGLVHIDVEGFEKKVLSGAKGLIEGSRPVVLFEQHIATEDPSEVFSLLQPHDYRLYMINEVLPDSALDCRNFIAFPAEMDVSVIAEAKTADNAESDIWYATVGNLLIPCTPEA